MIQKPMLAATLKNIDELNFPVLASPKLDGIRCLKVNGKALTRKFKPVPNKFIRDWLESNLPDGIDGEIMIANATFNQIQSGVMSEDGEPEFEFHAFDLVTNSCDTPFETRYKLLQHVKPHQFQEHLQPLRLVPHVLINNQEELDAFETQCLAQGYEGVMVRSVKGPYKNGRSTEKESYLLKVKRFADSEAIVTGYDERLHNANEATIDELGHTKRSSHKANMIPDNTLGAFHVKDIHTGQEFKVSTGMDDALRKSIWDNRDSYIGKLVKYKYQPAGQKDLPRFPVFLGFRDERDMS
jgi:DNA ligase-1